MGGGEKAKNFKGTIGKIIKYMGRYKIAVFTVMIFALGSTIFNVVCPKILGKATTELASGIMNKISGNGGINFVGMCQRRSTECLLSILRAEPMVRCFQGSPTILIPWEMA